MLDINELKFRKQPTKYEKYEEYEKSNIVRTNKTKLYEYYKCDYCKSEIKINVSKDEKTGGIVIFPHTLTKCGELELVLCNKCLKKALKQFEERKNKK